MSIWSNGNSFCPYYFDSGPVHERGHPRYKNKSQCQACPRADIEAEDEVLARQELSGPLDDVHVFMPVVGDAKGHLGENRTCGQNEDLSAKRQKYFEQCRMPAIHMPGYCSETTSAIPKSVRPSNTWKIRFR